MKIGKELKRGVSRRSFASTGLKDGTRRNEKTGKDFKSHILNSKTELVLEELNEIKGKIEVKGNALLEYLTWENFLDYREAIKEFMEIYVKESHILKEIAGQGIKGRRKIYTLIDKVDEELDKLAEAVLEGESGKIKAASSISEIRGLLIDVLR